MTEILYFKIKIEIKNDFLFYSPLSFLATVSQVAKKLSN